MENRDNEEVLSPLVEMKVEVKAADINSGKQVVETETPLLEKKEEETPQKPEPEKKMLEEKTEATKVQPTVKKKASFGRKLIGVILCILLVISIMMTITLSCVRRLLSGDGLKNFIKSAFSGSFASQVYDDATDKMMAEVSDTLGIDVAAADEDEMEDMYYETISNLIAYSATGEGTAVDVEMWMDYFEDHQEEIAAASGREITDEDFDRLEEELNAANEELMEDFENNIEAEADEPVFQGYALLIGFSMSNVKYYCCVALTALLLILILCVFSRYADYAFIYLGVTFTVTGGLWFLVVAILAAVKSVGSWVSEGLGDYFGGLMKTNIIVAASILAGGIFLNIIGHIIRKQK